MILIADDETNIRKMIKMGLERKNSHKTITASNGQEAIELLAKNNGQICLIILDCVMPVMTGLQAFPFIRKLNPNLPVIFCTGHDPDDKIKKYIVKDPRVFLLKKPFLLKELGEIIEGLCPLICSK